jgi:hypothetical protein
VAFGYRLFQVEIGQYRKPEVRYDFDNVGLHSEGAFGLFRDTLASMIASSARDDDRLTYFGLDDVEYGGWVFQISASNGSYGRVRRVRNTSTNKDGKPLGKNDAVLDDLPLVLVIPSYGRYGLLVAATSGRTHNAFSFARAVDQKWRERGLAMKLVSDLADRTAWSTFLGQSDVDVTHVELIQSSVTPERPTFGTSGHVSRARVMLTLADSQTKKSVLDRVKDKVLRNKDLALAGVFGMSLKDADFDDYGVLYVKDGRQKRLSISNDYPHFIYPLDGTTEPSASELASSAMSDVEYLMSEIGIKYPNTWMPTTKTLTKLDPPTEATSLTP